MSTCSRRDLLFASIAAAALPLSGAKPEPRTETKAPNILYILLDDLGTDLGSYGGTSVETPNLDRLAREGMRFTQAYSGCSVCAPARSTLLTGTHMGHTPVRRNSGGVSLQADTYTVAEMLAGAGYRCGGFGKWGVGDLDTPGVPEKHGFSKFFGYYHQVHAHFFFPDYLIDTGRKVPLPGNKGTYAQPNDALPPGPVRMTTESGQRRQFSQYLIFEEMKKFLREDRQQPFFCYAPWTVPHGRFHIPEDDTAWQMYKDKPWSIEARVYAAFVTMSDRMVGEVLDLLDELGVAENTVIFFSSDNGAAAAYPELKSPGKLRGGKTSMYEGGLRIPFIVRWPGKITAGSESDLPVYFPDFLPTVAAIAGIEPTVPHELDGESYLPELLGELRLTRDRKMYWEWNKDHFAEYTVYMQAHRDGKWKLVRNEPNKPWELYDLAEDPSEVNDLASLHPDRVAAMEAWIHANRVDPFPQVEPDKTEGQRWR
jgi:arylsulfatase A